MRRYLLLAVASLALASCATQKALPQRTEAQREAERKSLSYWQPQPEAADTGAHQHRPPVWTPGDSVLWAHHKQAHSPDSSVGKPSAPRRLFGLLPAKKVVSSPEKVPSDRLSGGELLNKNKPAYKEKNTSEMRAFLSPTKKCKGCTFNIVAGNQTVAGKKAQVAAGDNATASVVGKNAGPAVVGSDSTTQNAVGGGGNLATVRGNDNSLPQTATTQQAAGWKAMLAKPIGAVLAAALAVSLVGGCFFLIAAYRRRKQLEA